MKYIRNWTNFLESIQYDLSRDILDLSESLKIWHDALLTSIGAKEVDIFKTLLLPEDFRDNLDIEYLCNNVEFINSLSSIGLKKSTVQNTDDFENFLNKPCKFMLIYDINSNELEDAEYLLFQTWNETLNKWEDCKLYTMNLPGAGNVQKTFFDKLTSKTIEIVDGESNYIYTTSNGNDWVLQNSDKANDTYLKILRKEELQKLLDEKKVVLNII